MKLKLQERLTILEMLPKEGSFADLLLVKQITDSVAPKSEETDYYGIIIDTTEQGTSIVWDSTKSEEVAECYMATAHIKLLKAAFEKLDNEKKITISNFLLAQKIFEAAKELNI